LHKDLIEQSGDFQQAYITYDNALRTLPELTECRTRLGVVAIKTNRYSEAVDVLTDQLDEQSTYLRGLAYAKQGEIQKAGQEWHSLPSNSVMNAQRKALRALAQWEKLLLLRQIEQSVDANALDAAKTSSVQFLQKFGQTETVEANLHGHIQARIESELWQSQDWTAIAKDTQQTWLSQQDIKSLHNWAIARYYSVISQSGQTAYTASLQAFIPVWLTALANFKSNTVLHQSAWTNSESVNAAELVPQLKQKLETLIDEFKEKDVKIYLQLRDHYRLGVTASRLVADCSDKLIVLPGCLAGDRIKQLGSKDSESLVVRSLYTNWGLSVAACLEGDAERAIQLQPSLSEQTDEQKYARQFVAYHEGCYYLQNGNWRRAMTALQLAQTEILINLEWRDRIDQLCDVQRQKLTSQEEYQFSELWYELVKSQTATRYLTTQRTEAIREQLVAEKISEVKAKEELQKILSLDARNPVTLDLRDKVQAQIDIPAILRLLKTGNTQAAIRLAKQSNSKLTRIKVAELLITILLDGAKQGQMSSFKIRQFGQWAYELAPDEPSFQDIFHSLGIY
jgi:hypothetical protein